MRSTGGDPLRGDLPGRRFEPAAGLAPVRPARPARLRREGAAGGADWARACRTGGGADLVIPVSLAGRFFSLPGRTGGFTLGFSISSDLHVPARGAVVSPTGHRALGA